MKYRSVYFEDSYFAIDPKEVIGYVVNVNSGAMQGHLTESAKLFKYFVSPIIKGLRTDEYGFSAWFKTKDEALKFIEKEKGWTDAK